MKRDLVSSNCEYCNTPFLKKSLKHRFCCSKCKDAHTRENKPTLVKTCECCGHTFETKDKPVRFCSLACATKATVPVKEVVCVECGIVFQFRGRTRKHRCDTCRKVFLSKYQMKWRTKRNPNIKIGVGSGGAQWGELNHEWKPEDQRVSTRYKSNYRKRCFRVWPKCCACCSVPESEDVTLEVHHVNGNPDDFSGGNLIPLCFSCHMKKIHFKRYATPDELIEATFSILSEECRNKIAELSGKSCITGQSEPKAM